MNIRSYDSPTRFWVSASSDKDVDEYLVDIVEPCCTCMDFKTRRWPKIRDNVPGKHFCKHIRFARDYFLNEILEAFKRQEENEQKR